MPSKKKVYHAERDSPFFRLRPKEKLADLLFCSLSKLMLLASGGDLYFSFAKPKKNGGVRTIDAPRQDLKGIQSRIAELLQRIVPPDFLFAPVAGRSYVDNAAHHLGSRSVRLLDIEDFFPSFTENRVIWFFMKRMQCSPDVAAILRGIVTRNGSLPQGSPCSPILAYLCYADMWEEISRLVSESQCRLSVYADDLTISGKSVPEATIWGIKKALRRFGHRYNVKKERRRRDKPAEITGVILQRDTLLLPNRQHQKLVLRREQLKASKSPKQRVVIQNQIRGSEAQAKQIVQHVSRLSYVDTSV